jgi:beta-glucosidase
MTCKECEGGWNVKVKVTNKGKVAGKDVVQLYVKAPKGKLDKPERELKGFAKTPLLNPGETVEVDIFISKESLASYDESASSWITEKGNYIFIAAKDALDSSCKEKIRID